MNVVCFWVYYATALWPFIPTWSGISISSRCSIILPLIFWHSLKYCRTHSFVFKNQIHQTNDSTNFWDWIKQNVAPWLFYAITFKNALSTKVWNYPTTINIKYEYKHLPFLNWLKNWLKTNKKEFSIHEQFWDVFGEIKRKVTTWASS